MSLQPAAGKFPFYFVRRGENLLAQDRSFTRQTRAIIWGHSFITVCVHGTAIVVYSEDIK